MFAYRAVNVYLNFQWFENNNFAFYPQVVNDSAISNSAVIVGCEDGKSLVPYYLWTDYLNMYYRHLPALKGYHYFTTSAQKPGMPVAKIGT